MQSVSFHQHPDFLVSNALLVSLVIDGDERNVRAVSLHKHNMSNDPRSATLALAFRGNRETNFAQVFPQLGAH